MKRFRTTPAMILSIALFALPAFAEGEGAVEKPAFPRPTPEEMRREAPPGAPRDTGIKGRVTIEGSAGAEVSVMIYAAGAAALAGPEYLASIVTAADGGFQTNLSPGIYRVAARKRGGGRTAGPLRPGDLATEYSGNPVTVALGTYTDIGELPLHAVDLARLAEMERGWQEGTLPTRVSGVVTDAEGKPLAGQFVLLYRAPEMTGRPERLAPSAEDGSFTFDLPGAGTWYLCARNVMRGPRGPGQLAGQLAGSPDSSVTLDAGEKRNGLVIRMEELR